MLTLMEIRHNEFFGTFPLEMDVPRMYSMSPQGYSASWSKTINSLRCHGG